MGFGVWWFGLGSGVREFDAWGLGLGVRRLVFEVWGLEFRERSALPLPPTPLTCLGVWDYGGLV